MSKICLQVNLMHLLSLCRFLWNMFLLATKFIVWLGCLSCPTRCLKYLSNFIFAKPKTRHYNCTTHRLSLRFDVALARRAPRSSTPRLFSLSSVEQCKRLRARQTLHSLGKSSTNMQACKPETLTQLQSQVLCIIRLLMELQRVTTTVFVIDYWPPLSTVDT
ncbi:hypothetical protein BGX38DRAFT_746635 [Terfezia claveryi]|nr:hypothetical protein BGX38DRAFT_746635 [Terfezia claveryi]